MGLLLIKPAELMLFYTGADGIERETQNLRSIKSNY
jgi:hypothetical protein